MEKILNIYFYNFYLLTRFFNKLLVIYLNPFVWLNNRSKMKLGSKLFFEHMEKNFPTFLNQYKFIFRLKIQFIPFLFLLNILIFIFLLFICKINISEYYFIILVGSFLVSCVESYVYIFSYDKYHQYFKEFYETKKYDYPILTFLFILLMFFAWLSIVFFDALS